MTKNNDVERLAGVVVREWRDQVRQPKLLSEFAQRAVIAKIVMDMMSSQDDQQLPISKFSAIYEAASRKLGLEDV